MFSLGNYALLSVGLSHTIMKYNYFCVCNVFKNEYDSEISLCKILTTFLEPVFNPTFTSFLVRI